MPAPEHIKELARKYLQGTISPEEEQELNAWYNAHPDGDILWDRDETGATVKQRLFTNIRQQFPDAALPAIGARNKRKLLWRTAAAAVVVLLVSATYLLFRDNPAPSIVQTPIPVDNTPQSYTRYIRLPDGSSVILHANSTLSYPPVFAGDTREISLNGEAYFDIAHDASRPFIIHTGKVKTTVLGTAFNIAAYPDGNQVVVSVDRGKVKVEAGEKLLAVLTQDQQVTYNIPGNNAIRQTLVSDTDAINWLKEDMSFDGTSFATIAGLLSKRYNAQISFKNPAMENCTIKAFFRGTESLEKVLERLALISNASYTRTKDNNIVIDGEGCK